MFKLWLSIQVGKEQYCSIYRQKQGNWSNDSAATMTVVKQKQLTLVTMKPTLLAATRALSLLFVLLQSPAGESMFVAQDSG